MDIRGRLAEFRKQMEQEQMDKEQQRLEEIRKLEQENEIKDFLSSLQ